MSSRFQPGDFLIYQLESGYALLRLLRIDDADMSPVWHIAAYADFFPDVESAESTVLSGIPISVAEPHVALTNRAFESTQVARIASRPLTAEEQISINQWSGTVSDRSVRLMLGFR